jgi:hypothetical protein
MGFSSALPGGIAFARTAGLYLLERGFAEIPRKNCEASPYGARLARAARKEENQSLQAKDVSPKLANDHASEGGLSLRAKREDDA